MCGIAGQFTFQPQPTESPQLIAHLAALMARRGPDDGGSWTDGEHCAFGFRRLAILDLSPAGNQPMLTPDGRYALVMNGEVYNFNELRTQLEQKGHRFRSSGDAEVVLYALVAWGKEALQRFNGMFAMAFYDTVEKKLLLARDHAGIKPLYYLRHDRGLVFASQYDQLLAHPWSRGLPYNQGAVALYFRFGYIPAPYALLENTHMLQPGCWLELDTSGKVTEGRFFEFPIYTQPDLSGAEANEAVDEAVTRAVKRQMVSDVPLGSFLSGGVDSPLVTAVAQSLSAKPVKAFSIGVKNSPLDESADAMLYARQIGVEHHLEMIQLDQVEELVQDVTAACSEPFGDYSIFPTLLAARHASRNVKVMLSGDGGDELFWGYTGRMGTAIRYAHLFKNPFWYRKLRWWLLRRPIEWNARYFKTPGRWYQSLHEHNFDGWLENYFPGIAPLPEDYGQYHYSGCEPERTAQWVRWNEFTGHMQNGLLKVDRGSMFHSLEVRVPLLDREVISTAARVDWRSCLDIEQDLGKIPLRVALSKRVSHFTNTKRGFTVPMADWLRGPLRTMFEELVINRKELLGQEINQPAVKQAFDSHLSGSENREWGLWIILSAALWQGKYLIK